MGLIKTPHRSSPTENGNREVYTTSWGGTPIGLRPGIRAKYYGHDWAPAQFDTPLPPPEVFDAIAKVTDGIPLMRSELPEAASVWNERAFAKKGDLFAIGGFYAVRGKMAEIFTKFDFGEGGLVPVPLFGPDLETSWPEPCWWINFGASKGCFVAAESKNLYRHGPPDKPVEDQTWSFNGPNDDGSIAVTPAALTGASLWTERQLRRQIFMSGRLAKALMAAKVRPKLRLGRAAIVGG